MGNRQTRLTQSRERTQEDQPLGLEHKTVSALVQLRKSKKMSQEELARKLNTKQSVISRIETGVSVPSLRFVKRVARALDAEVDITFQPRNIQETSSPSYPSKNNIEYICVDCLYRWESKIGRSVMQCPQCHKRQGVMFSEYSRALRAYRNIRLQVKESPPLTKPPPVRSVRNIPDVLKVILETAASTFPSPRLPISLLFRIIEQSRQEKADAQRYNTIEGSYSVKEYNKESGQIT